MRSNELLIEIGSEELPPTILSKLITAVTANIEQALAQAKLTHNGIKGFITPRRIAVTVTALAAKQPEQLIEKRGPALSAAFDQAGKPTKATLGFAKSCNTTVKNLTELKTPKGSWLFYLYRQPGKRVSELMPTIIEQALKQLPIPKLMRWYRGDVEFIRPIHWLLILYGRKVLPAEIMGVRANNKTYGHRFHHPQQITINDPGQYETILQTKGRVIAGFATRKATIEQQLGAAAKPYGSAITSPELLTEVTGLVEWPVALVGSFPKRFLKLPAEVLILTLQKHQKCFAIRDKKGRLVPYFITISNIESTNPQQVITGNERVINARLNDAEFFYHRDVTIPLEEQREKLTAVIFQLKLGSLYAKTVRVTKLAHHIAQQLNVELATTEQAAQLAKADLVTEMVFEFPELQGIMGYYYASAQGKTEAIAVALKEQYQPRFANDSVPATAIGSVLAIADRLDTLLGIFGINNAPSGTKDPFGLRRAALGILHIVIENSLPLDLAELIDYAVKNFELELENSATKQQTLNFILERLKTWYLAQGIKPQTFAAVYAKFPSKPLDFDSRIKAVQEFQKLPQAEALASANKRVSNILNKSSDAFTLEVNNSLLIELAEQTLAKLLEQKIATTTPLYEQQNYSAALTSLASLKQPIDNFFDQVMVNVEDSKLRLNRLALLAKLQKLFLYVADISLL